MYDVVVIGAGISGLTVAYELGKLHYHVVVLERQTRPGGNAISERLGGFLMEHGPSTVNAGSTVAARLSTELSLDDERCDLGSGVRQRYLVNDGVLHGISVHPLGFLRSNYLSIRGRLRMMAEATIPRTKAKREETVTEFCTRRFGREFAERVMDPLVGGLYAGRANDLSVSAVFPKLVEMERQSGSIAHGVIRQRRRGGRMPGSRLFSWRNGIGSLPGTLAQELGTAVRTGVAVRRLDYSPRGFKLDAGPQGRLTARAVVVATQPHVASRLLERVDGSAAAAAGEIDAPPLAVVFLGFRREQVDHPLDGLGFLAPQAEGRSLTGAQFCSTMFPDRAPNGYVAVAAYLGGARMPEIARLSATELIALARQEFADMIGAHGEPIVARVRHWPLGLPQYALGHAERIGCLRTSMERTPGLFITGNYFEGPSVATCLEVATKTARSADRFLARTGRESEQQSRSDFHSQQLA